MSHARRAFGSSLRVTCLVTRTYLRHAKINQLQYHHWSCLRHNVYLFIKVRGSRPMTYQFSTVEMVCTAKTNGGLSIRKISSTRGMYAFDSLFLTDTSMQVLDGYIDHIRPRLVPTCDYVLVTSFPLCPVIFSCSPKTPDENI